MNIHGIYGQSVLETIDLRRILTCFKDNSMNIAKPLFKLAMILATKKFLDIHLPEYKAAGLYHWKKTLFVGPIGVREVLGVLLASVP